MEDITVQEIKTRRDNGEKLVIIDVREPYEFDEFNINGTLIPLGDLPGRLDELEEFKDSEIIVHCRSGARSASAKGFLTQNGFTKVRNMLGGVMAWQANFG
jgi:rhodanese-related sulfurtransferase